MGKITEALKKAAQERLARLEKLGEKSEVRYEFVAKKLVDSKIDARIVTFHFMIIQAGAPVIAQHEGFFINDLIIRHDHPGIAYAYRTARTLGEMIRSIILLYEVLTPEEIAGHVEYL